jgi:large subunit ribosomal protein L7/L12
VIQAKKFAESVPQMLKENVPKEEAEKLRAAYEALGAKLVLE